MKNFYYKGLEYFYLPYRDFIANNLSVNGVVIFKTNINNKLEQVKQDIESAKHFGKISIVTIRIYDKNKENIECWNAFVNDKIVSSFGFFDFFRLESSRLLLGEFYACDFKLDKIYLISQYSINEIGTLKNFKDIFGINEDRTIVLRKTKFVAPEGFTKYFSKARAFRNQVERDFSIYEEIMGYNHFDKYYSFEECKDKLDVENNILKFENDTILEFNIDDPTLSLKTKGLKARNLNIKDLYAESEDVFCDHIKSQNIYAGNILAESIECESITASTIKTNYKYGLKIIN